MKKMLLLHKLMLYFAKKLKFYYLTRFLVLCSWFYWCEFKSFDISAQKLLTVPLHELALAYFVLAAYWLITEPAEGGPLLRRLCNWSTDGKHKQKIVRVEGPSHTEMNSDDVNKTMDKYHELYQELLHDEVTHDVTK